MCVALAALEAVVIAEGPNGERRIAFSDFHRLPGDTPNRDTNLDADELITAIELPAKGFSKNYTYIKIRDRLSYAFALVSVAAALELDGGVIKEARLALGGVAHKPWRDETAEAELADPESMLSLYRSALRIRREHPALGDGSLEWLDVPYGAIAFRREPGFACLVNLSADPLPLLAGSTVVLASGQLTDGNRIPADTAVWLTRR